MHETNTGFNTILQKQRPHTHPDPFATEVSQQFLGIFRRILSGFLTVYGDLSLSHTNVQMEIVRVSSRQIRSDRTRGKRM